MPESEGEREQRLFNLTGMTAEERLAWWRRQRGLGMSPEAEAAYRIRLQRYATRRALRIAAEAAVPILDDHSIA